MHDKFKNSSRTRSRAYDRGGDKTWDDVVDDDDDDDDDRSTINTIK